jgi:hypothetical protein
MGKEPEKSYSIEVPIDGKTYIYSTDLICNSCGKELQDGDYLYFCMDEKDDLCSSFNCLKKHAGHRFFRWGKIQMGPVKPDFSSRPAPPTGHSSAKPIKTALLPGIMPSLPAGPLAPQAPLKSDPSAMSMMTMRTEMLRELKCLKSVMKEESEE